MKFVYSKEILCFEFVAFSLISMTTKWMEILLCCCCRQGNGHPTHTSYSIFVLVT